VARKKWQQLALAPRTWGGRRKGAGRKRRAFSRVPHRRRPILVRRTVVHIVVKLVREAGVLRRMKLAPLLRRAFTAGALRGGFRVCHFSIQRSHIHLVVEVDSTQAMGRGMQAWSGRLARLLNRRLRRRGRVMADRYHVELLRSPRQVRNALCYVLQNARRHGESLDPRWCGIDPFSSAWHFDGWCDATWREHLAPPRGDPPVAPPTTWLLTTGWRRHGLIAVDEVPAAARQA
jgi:REP element-mobilizing transposase RayT